MEVVATVKTITVATYQDLVKHAQKPKGLLEEFASMLQKLPGKGMDPVIGRDEEIIRAIEISTVEPRTRFWLESLGRKTAVVEGLA